MKHEKCELLNSNPLLLERHFQHCIETFFKEILLITIGKVTYYAIRIEFQVRGSPGVHSFMDSKFAKTFKRNLRNVC